jgi:hypothetical protein
LKLTLASIRIWLGIISYVGLLKWSYIYSVVPIHSYRGYTYYPPTMIYELISWIAALMPLFWITTLPQRPSRVVYWLLYIIVYMPSCIIPFYVLSSNPNKIVLFILALTSAMWLLRQMYKIPLLRLPVVRLSKVYFWVGLSLLGSSLTGIIMFEFGLRFNMPSIDEVYNVRFQYRDKCSSSQSLGSEE